MIDYSGPEAADRKLAEIQSVIASLQETPHKGTLRDDIALGLRAIPAGRKAVIAFVVDDETQNVMIYAVTYNGADWISRTALRRGEP